MRFDNLSDYVDDVTIQIKLQDIADIYRTLCDLVDIAEAQRDEILSLRSILDESDVEYENNSHFNDGVCDW